MNTVSTTIRNGSEWILSTCTWNTVSWPSWRAPSASVALISRWMTRYPPKTIPVSEWSRRRRKWRMLGPAATATAAEGDEVRLDTMDGSFQQDGTMRVRATASGGL